jgi:serine/threonine protein kinase
VEDYLSRVILVACGIASGAQHLHKYFKGEKTMHRDLNASNVLLDDHWIPKIGDFGLARTASDDTVAFTTNEGSPSSIAPEMIDPNVKRERVHGKSRRLGVYDDSLRNALRQATIRRFKRDWNWTNI